MKLFLILPLLFLGCSKGASDVPIDIPYAGPNEGDIYEDLLTGERIEALKSSVLCGESFDAAEEVHEARNLELDQITQDDRN